MSRLVHAGADPEMAAVPPVDMADLPELLDTPPRAPRAVDECDGPGPLLREVGTPLSIDVELVEDCPTCAGAMQHRFRRVIRLEDQ
jgi:hypothetical protein